MNETQSDQSQIEIAKPTLFKYLGVFRMDYKGIHYEVASKWEHKLTDLIVLRSLATLKNGEAWIHVSASRRDEIPSWLELMKVKNEFIGEHREAYQVLPAALDYVNFCKHALHLWAPIDGKRRVANLIDLVKESPL